MSGIRDGYPTVSEWLPGDRVSAAKLNNQLDLIDAAVGLDEQRVYPFDAGASLFWCEVHQRPFEGDRFGDQVEFWLAHNGDQLVIALGGNAPAYLFWRNNENQTPDATLAPNAVHTINLAQTQRGIADLYQYEPCRIILRSTLFPDENLYVKYIYQRNNSAATTLGTLPTFTNGGVSVAEDLNTIRNATDLALDILGQPIACQYSNRDKVATRSRWQGYIRHTHNKLLLDINASCSGFDFGDTLYLEYNGQIIWSWVPQTGRLYFDGAVTLDLPAGLTIGTWYKVQLWFTRTTEHDQIVTVYSMAEVPGNTLTTIAPTTRWTHGDVLNGSAGGPPRLAQMSTALGGVSTSLRWINQPCRTAGSIKGENCYGDEFVDSMASTRVHRWLAYKSFQMLTGEYARPQIQWFINGRGLGSYSLPQVTVPSFFDLESTPVKPGMWFKLSGVEFGIQTPQSGSSYA